MHASDPIREVDGGVEVRVLVVPNASRSEIVGLHGDRIRVRVAAPPEHGTANAAVCTLLCKTTGAKTATVTVGAANRRKTITLSGVTTDTIRILLEL